MQYFKYKSQNDGTKGPRLLGQIFLASGIVVILTAFFVELDTAPVKIALVGGGALVLGIFLSSINSGILFDFRNKKFKEYQKILWFESGEWVELPEINHAEIIHHTYRTSFIPNGITPTFNGLITIYKVVLLADGTKFLALDFATEKDAVAGLEVIKERLGI
ncbi:hypothetical protein [Algoriphagus chordae]|uniref:PH (Pleckstrin Homology) domain-containing protein n=1 Tax=Algoriphagus chordae TaxID=237019 RepID=A0A2W7RCT4_9BACT|nr:hypothetical protein [Algoriphagus chordae]PZX57911.1 hypothetical protein LV85_00094 [Algoriphagus chordae]